MSTYSAIYWSRWSRARVTIRAFVLIFSAVVLLLSSGGLAVRPAAAARVDPTGHSLFHRLWARTELPVVAGQSSRSWIWGETAISPLVAEPNANNTRMVQYFDKGGMQFNSDPVIQIGNPAFVLASPLAYEMITGQLATGQQWEPSGTGIAGDADDSTGATYASFAGLRGAPAAENGVVLTEAVDRAGAVFTLDRLAGYGVKAAHRVTVPGLDHQIAAPFWDFIQSTGTVYEAARYKNEPLFEDQWASIGLPLSEAYWSDVKLGGNRVDVLIQVFERRVLTYTPSEPEGWQVQIANTGRHYVDWRYGGNVAAELTAPPEALPTPSAPDYAALQSELLDVVSSTTGAVAVSVLDIQTGQTISINGDRRQLAACTIKIPIMIAVAQDISDGKYTAAEVEHLVIPAMGPSLTWHARELLRMTGDGDIGVGVRRANDILESLGVERSLMTHAPGYWGEEHGYFRSRGEVENWLTTDDLTRILAGIWNGVGMTPAERSYVLWSLTLATPFLDATFHAPLPAGIAAYHKIGVLYQPENTWNDAGIVVLERNGQEYAYVVAFLSNRNPGTYLNGYYLNQSVNALVWQTFSTVR